MNLSLFDLTKKDVLLLKAFAIISIVLHNFYHMIFEIGENEMEFNASAFYTSIDLVRQNPAFFFASFFSYLGHFGVQVFIFCTGFGVAKSFVNKDLKTYPRYLLKKIGMLYLLIIIGLIWYAFFNIDTISLKTLKEAVLFFFKMTSAFSRVTLFGYIGSWWYLCLALQLYLFFPVLFFIVRKYREKGIIILLLLAYILIYGFSDLAESNDIPFFANAVGHLPELLFGIAAATFRQLRINWKILSLALVLFTLSCLNVHFFPFGFLSMLIIILAVSHFLIKGVSKCKRVKVFFLYIGTISMFIFVLNGQVRDALLFYFYSYKADVFVVNLYGYTIIHVMLVMLVSSFTYWAFGAVKRLVGQQKKIQ